MRCASSSDGRPRPVSIRESAFRGSCRRGQRSLGATRRPSTRGSGSGSSRSVPPRNLCQPQRVLVLSVPPLIAFDRQSLGARGTTTAVGHGGPRLAERRAEGEPDVAILAVAYGWMTFTHK